MESGSIKLNREMFDMNVTIQNMARDTKDNMPDGVQLLIETAPEPLLVEADKSRIYEVVVNLLSDAAKFTNNDSIVIKAEKKRQHDDGSRQYALVTVRET